VTTNVRRGISLCWLFALVVGGLVGGGAGLDAEASQNGPEPAASDARQRDPRVPPKKRKKLLKWLLEGTYRDMYVAEPAVHDSLGPHGGNVRTYYNAILVDDLNAGRAVWSKGAAMVKELYFSGAEEVQGYSVMIKAEAESGSNGEGWVFYETFNLTGANAYYGRGLRLCSNCHDGGTDFLLSAFRPSPTESVR
jgi:hypothetical protein